MNQPSSAPASPSSSSARVSVPRAKRRLQARLGPDVRIVGWGKAWVSREGRLPRPLAARTSDFVVIADDRLVLYSTGFFTRRPRRRVFDESLERLEVLEERRGRGRHVRVNRHFSRRPPLLFDFSSRARNTPLVTQLIQLTKKDGPA